jgi:hypothetical protein
LQIYEPKKKSFKVKFKGNCKYCKKYGHKVDDCYSLKKKLEKQGTLLALACFESNIVDVPSDTWWLDSGATIHVVNSLQGFTSLRKPSDTEAKVIVGDGARVPVLEIGVVSLLLPYGHNLILKDAVYVPSMRRNLISVSALDKSGNTFNFGNGKLVVCFKSTAVCSGILRD